MEKSDYESMAEALLLDRLIDEYAGHPMVQELVRRFKEQNHKLWIRTIDLANAKRKLEQY